MNKRIEPYRPEFFVYEDIREYERSLQGPDRLAFMLSVCHCLTLFVNDAVICHFGYIEIWPGVLEVFIIPTYRVNSCPKTFLATAKNLVRDIQINERAHRVQTASLSNTATNKFMRHLGFTCESTMVRYSPDQQDYRMWTRLANGL